MDLLGIRKQFIKTSGRTDMVADEINYADNGADYYINAGIRSLDGLVNTPKTFASHIVSVSAGATGVVIPKVRSLHEAWISSASGRYIMERKDIGWLRENYPLGASTERGTPLYWAVAPIGLAPGQLDLDSADFAGKYDWDDISFGEHESYNGLMWMPPCDTAYTLRVLGRFKSRVLSSNTDMNWWTIEYPELVVASAMQKLEEEYRNSQGVNDWEQVIAKGILAIEKDNVRQDWAGVSVMKG